jgi:hypothetical protein
MDFDSTFFLRISFLELMRLIKERKSSYYLVSIKTIVNPIFFLNIPIVLKTLRILDFELL